MTKADILKALPEALPRILPLARISRLRPSTGRRKARHYDLAFDLAIGGTSRRIIGEVKAIGEPRHVLQAIAALELARKKEKGVYPVVIAPYLSPESRQLCQEAEVGFIDLAGNVFLRFDDVLIERTGQALPREQRAQLRQLLAPKSSRILRVLLENPEKTWTLQALAREAEVSLRLAFLVAKALDEKGYVEKKRGAIALVKPGALLDFWAQNARGEAREQQTYYTLIKGHQRFFQALATASKVKGFPYALTLHAGASLVAPFVRFTDIHFYCTGRLEALVEALDLRPVEMGGTVHVLTPRDEGIFYHLQEIDGIKVVCNTQLYLDLFTYPARGREQAEFLRRQKIGF